MPIKNQKKWYAAYYESTRNYSFLKHRWNIMHLKKMNFFSEVNRDKIIVDIGCGDGNMLKTLLKNQYSRLFGFDIVIPETHDSKIVIKKGSMLDIPYEDGFADVIICFNVMHHLTDEAQYKLFVNNCEKLLKGNGLFFLVEPQKNFFRKIQDIIINIPIISKIGPVKLQKVAVEEEKEEIDKFCKLNVEKILNDNGFSIIQYETFFKSFICKSRKIGK